MDNSKEERIVKIDKEVEEALKKEEVIQSIENLVESILDVTIDGVLYDYHHKELKVTFYVNNGVPIISTQTILFKGTRAFFAHGSGLLSSADLSKERCDSFHEFKSLIHKHIKTVENEERMREIYNAIDEKIINLAYTQEKVSKGTIYLVSSSSFYSIQRVLGLQGIVPISVGKIELFNGLVVKMSDKLEGLDVAISIE